MVFLLIITSIAFIILIIIEKMLLFIERIKKPEGRYNIGWVSDIGTYLK